MRPSVRHDDARQPTELVIVACHATYVRREIGEGTRDSHWLIQPFQMNEQSEFILHAVTGVEIGAAAPREGMLIFSGGRTAGVEGAPSEAVSYVHLCQDLEWFGYPEVASMAFTESYARDSFENILYSICRFREVAGRYPIRIHVVSWPFKEERFEMHRKALRISAAMWNFCGRGHPADPSATVLGEESTRRLWGDDPYGTWAPLCDKKLVRSRDDHREEYGSSCPEMVGILTYGERMIFTGGLPWTYSR